MEPRNNLDVTTIRQHQHSIVKKQSTHQSHQSNSTTREIFKTFRPLPKTFVSGNDYMSILQERTLLKNNNIKRRRSNECAAWLQETDPKLEAEGPCITFLGQYRPSSLFFSSTYMTAMYCRGNSTITACKTRSTVCPLPPNTDSVVTDRQKNVKRRPMAADNRTDAEADGR